MTLRKRIVPVLALAALLLAPAAAPALEIGDPAPALAIDTWTKGEAVKLKELAEKDKVTVVEFWATWCPPCRTSIPHLTELQKKYKDKAVFIGVSAEDADTVKPFVEKMGEKMTYHVAVDKDDKTTKAYMEPFNVSGIPHAFLVDKEGRLVYHNHPMEPAFEEALAAAVEGEFDLDAAQKRMNEEQTINEAINAYGALIMEEGGDETKAQELAGELYGLLEDNAEVLASLAYALAEGEDIVIRDLDFAQKAAERAVELTERKDANALDSYATVLHARGQHEKAVEAANEALEATEDPEFTKHLEKQRARFQEGAGAAN
ncbi:MAG: redoxin family protein [Candidatus Hydrogenedentota bacterium]